MGKLLALPGDGSIAIASLRLERCGTLHPPDPAWPQYLRYS